MSQLFLKERKEGVFWSHGKEEKKAKSIVPVQGSGIGRQMQSACRNKGVSAGAGAAAGKGSRRGKKRVAWRISGGERGVWSIPGRRCYSMCGRVRVLVYLALELYRIK